MGAILQAQYPKLWPETIRALLIHSAEWTEPMCHVFGDKKSDHISRLRRYGYGIPNLERALFSAKNSLTLLVQQKIQPLAIRNGASKIIHNTTIWLTIARGSSVLNSRLNTRIQSNRLLAESILYEIVFKLFITAH